jgi:hypothetical protein
MVAGTSTIRTTVASISTADARPMPNILPKDVLAEDERDEHRHHDRGSRGDDPSGLGQAVGDGEGVVTAPVVLLLDPRDQEHLVVHGQPEQDREDPDRQEDRHGRPLGDADEVAQWAAADRQCEHPERGGTREQVHRHRLEGDHDGAEDQRQEEERQDQDSAEEQREL